MHDQDRIVRAIRAALEQEPRINPHRNAIRLTFANGTLAVEGEVTDIAAKRLAVQRVKAVYGIYRTIDRLHVRPAMRKGDGAVRDAVCDFLLREPALQDCAVRASAKGRLQALRAPREHGAAGIIVDVRGGVATLSGEVASLSHRRLAGVLAWWAPGCCDVVNQLRVVPVEYDDDHEITDALRLVLEKDPLVHAGQVRATARAGIVTLHGLLATVEESTMAERNAWYIDGVTDVVNRISVRH